MPHPRTTSRRTVRPWLAAGAAVVALAAAGCGEGDGDQTWDAGAACQANGGVRLVENDGDVFCQDGAERDNPNDTSD